MSWAAVTGSRLEINRVAHYTSSRAEMRDWRNELVKGDTMCAITGPEVDVGNKISLVENRGFLTEPANLAFMGETEALPLMGFWCKESTKLRGFSMVYLRSRMVCVPPPSLHMPFLDDFDWSSNSQSLACSGLVAQRKRKKFKTQKTTQQPACHPQCEGCEHCRESWLHLCYF